MRTMVQATLVSCEVGQQRSCRYGIRNVKIVAASGRMVVQDCAEAEDNTDARDKFFMYILCRQSGGFTMK